MIKCNLCNWFFNKDVDMLDLKMKKHEEWHEKSTYFGSSNVRTQQKVEWIYQ